MRKVLFLCTGNYYRSRFVELLFNWLAVRSKLDWTADSRGIATELGTGNIGPIAMQAVRELHKRGVELSPDFRWPMQLQENDLEQADLIIALDEDEHRPYMRERFPRWADKIDYWHIGDLHVATVAEALPRADREVRALIQRLQKPPLQEKAVR